MLGRRPFHNFVLLIGSVVLTLALAELSIRGYFTISGGAPEGAKSLFNKISMIDLKGKANVPVQDQKLFPILTLPSPRTHIIRATGAGPLQIGMDSLTLLNFQNLMRIHTLTLYYWVVPWPPLWHLVGIIKIERPTISKKSLTIDFSHLMVSLFEFTMAAWMVAVSPYKMRY